MAKEYFCFSLIIFQYGLDLFRYYYLKNIQEREIYYSLLFYFRVTVLQSMTLGIDVNRHKEIIVKAISALLPLLLKYFKLNHIYQVSIPQILILEYS